MNRMLVAAQWLLILLIFVSSVAVTVLAWRFWQEKQVNAYIESPEEFEIVPDDSRAEIAYAGLLERQQKHGEALEQLTQVLGQGDETLLPVAYFNRANINLREALSLSSSDGRQIPLIELAKHDYRIALALVPQMWDARYNLEIALRMVPEDPAVNENLEKKVISSQRSIVSKAFKVDLP